MPGGVAIRSPVAPIPQHLSLSCRGPPGPIVLFHPLANRGKSAHRVRLLRRTMFPSSSKER